MDHKPNVLFVFLAVSLTLLPLFALAQIQGRCVPTPPCYCNEECFRCGPGGCSKPSTYDVEAERQRQEAERQRQLEAERQRQQEAERQRIIDEENARRRQAAFEKSKRGALKEMKGISEGESGLKGMGSANELKLKEVGDTGKRSNIDESQKTKDMQASAIEPSTNKMKKDIDKVNKHLSELQAEIRGLQTLLRQYSASMRGNVSEFEKWQETFNDAADNSWKSSKEYVLSMFLQYNLLGSVERSAQKDVFRKLDRLINSADPKERRWIGEAIKKRKVELGRLKYAVAAISQGSDLASLLLGNQENISKNLDALLLVNDILETAKFAPWNASAHFQQAKMIGETYTDLAAFGFSCVNVRKLDKATDAYNREIKYLSTRIKDSVKETNCLKKCLDEYTERCFDKCTGKTRFGSPPPLPH